MGNIIWLASYPKSGNTWLRIFLNNLISNSKEESVDINNLHETGSISALRSLFDDMVGVESAHLTKEEIDFYRPFVHQIRSNQCTEKQFIKTHNAFIKNTDGEWILPLQATYKAIYLIRNPLDVCVSFAHHSGNLDFDTMIRQMSNPHRTLAISKKKQVEQLHQFLGSWSSHVKSWENLPTQKLLMVRYEDMKEQTLETFTKIVRFVGLQYSTHEIAKALEKSHISRLQKIEIEKGFREKTQIAKSFFRKGIVGSWREELSETQAQCIINDHKNVMIKYNYLDNNGRLKV